MGVFWTLPSTFLSASAAGGIALIRTISALGVFGSSIVGVLRQATRLFLGHAGSAALVLSALSFS